jgi:hypothetical protein
VFPVTDEAVTVIVALALVAAEAAAEAAHVLANRRRGQGEGRDVLNAATTTPAGIPAHGRGLDDHRPAVVDAGALVVRVLLEMVADVRVAIPF